MEIGVMVGEDRHIRTVEERVSFATSFNELVAFVVAAHEEGVDTKLGRASDRLQARQYLLQLVTYLRTLPVVPGELFVDE